MGSVRLNHDKYTFPRPFFKVPLRCLPSFFAAGRLESGLSEIPLREIPSACGRRYLFLPAGVLQSIEWPPLPRRVIVFFRRRVA